MFKDTIPKENQIKIVVTFVIVAALIVLIVVFREELFKVNENILDSEKFYNEYNKVSVDNVFKYVDVNKALEILKTDTAVVFFGFKECTWCQSYAPILNEVAKENGVETVYYCNILQDRKNNTEEYISLVNHLKDYLYSDENENKRIYVPDVYFIKEGKIIGHNNDTSMEAGTDVEEYYNLNKETLKESLNNLFKSIKNTCDDSGKGC